MPEQPLVSILMTSYNRQQYIAEAIESVLHSMYKNFELIIVDDCSKDRTVEIAREYEARDSRIKVHVNEQNLGDYPNRNKAASHASGKYLKYVDADDYIYPWGLELLVQMMEQFPDAGWGLCSLEQFVKRPFPFMLTPREAYTYHYEGPGLFHKAPLSSIIRRDIFNVVGGFTSTRMAGDFEMWHRLAQKYNVVLMPNGIAWYREHGGQEMNSYLAYQHVYECIRVQYLRDKNCPLDTAITTALLRKYKQSIQKEIVKNVVTFKWQNAKLIMKKLRAYQ